MDVDEEPLDYSMPGKNCKEWIFREEIKGIKEKPDAAGIETRIVFWNKTDKQKYYQSETI